MTTQIESLKLALDEIKRVKEICLREVGIGLCNEIVIAKLEEALAQEKALQALHDENERLGLYKDAYAQPEQEPVAWRAWFDADNSAKWLFTLWPEEEHPSFDWQPLYTTPPQRKPLTDEQILTIARDHYNPHQRPEVSFARAIEAAHGIKE